MRHAANPCSEVRVLVALALAMWLVAGIASVWEVLAMQWPESPFHVGVLAGPVGQLRGFSFAVGGGLLAGAWLWPTLYGAGRGRYALLLLALGALIHVGSLAYAAAHGMVGVQVIDPRADVRWVVYGRALGHALMVIALLDGFLRAAARLRAEPQNVR